MSGCAAGYPDGVQEYKEYFEDGSLRLVYHGGIADDGRFLLEYDLWFSWKCLGYVNPPDPHKDVTFGFNICVHDDDDGGRADHALYWKGNPVLPYRDESAFGTLTLKGL